MKKLLGPGNSPVRLSLACIGALILLFASRLYWNIEHLQPYVLIILPLFCATISLYDRRIPLSVLLLGTVVGVTAYYLAQRYPVSKSTVLVAPFQDDRFQARTRMFRVALGRSLVNLGDGSVARYPMEISSHRAAQRLFSEYKDLGTVVWGSSRWISLSFRMIEPLHIGPFLNTRHERLKIIRSVPLVGLRIDTDPISEKFIAAVVGARPHDTTYSLRLENLNLAASYEGRWTTHAHKALVFFLLATEHLVRAVSNGEYDRGEISCASHLFEKALKLFRLDQNPQLFAAIVNNQTVLSAFQSFYEEEQQKNSQNLQRLESLRSYIPRRGEEANVVKSNLKLLRSAKPSPRKRLA